MTVIFIALSIAAYAGAAFGFFTQVLLARTLSPEGYGVFSSALSTVTLLAPLAAFGIGMFWLKVFGIEGWKALRWIKPSLSFSAVSIALVLLVVYVWAIFAPHDSVSRNLLFILSIFILGQAAMELATSVCQLEERYMFLAAWQLVPHVLRFASLTILSLYCSQLISVTAVAAVYSMTSIIMLTAGGILMWRVSKGKLRLVGHGRPVTMTTYPTPGDPKLSIVLTETWPFGLSTVFHLIYFQSGIILSKRRLSR